MTQDETGWLQGLARAVATEVRRHRQRLNLSAQALSDRCAELGYSMPRSVLANLENGRRENVTLAELLILGKALGVPPSLLVFPVGETMMAEPLPGAERPTWSAYKWFTGVDPFPASQDPMSNGLHIDGDKNEWSETSLPMLMWSEEDTFVDQWRETRDEIDRRTKDAARHEDDEVRQLHLDLVDRAKKNLAQIESNLRGVRQDIRDLGAITRPLPEELAHIEKEKSKQ